MLGEAERNIYQDVGLRKASTQPTIFLLRDFQEINYPILWGGHLARFWLLGGRDAHPTINSWIFFYKD
ncbi:hypothetical protein CK516_33490 [Nostoc sp. 'Peltigera malacea cyanobiont' DB3992]|nr:hypothetical protein CK516_33490 [Nostoc sp. 'Peltigera malacea cyanobiont' DB3992]